MRIIILIFARISYVLRSCSNRQEAYFYFKSTRLYLGSLWPPLFTIWTSLHKIVFSLHFSAITLLPSLTKLVEVPLLPTEMRSSIEDHLRVFYLFQPISCEQGLPYMPRVLLYLSVKFFPIESSFPEYERSSATRIQP